VLERRTRRRSPLLFLFVTVFVDMIGYGIVIPLLPFYVRQYASGAVLIGLLGSLYAAMQFVGGPFLGGLSDRAGRRPVLLLCLSGASLAYLLLGLADTLLLLVTAVALAGGAGGTQATAQAYIADSTAPEDRARGLGLIGAAFGLGLIAGPVLGGLLSLFSLGAPAFAASALALSNVVFGLFVLPESLPAEHRASTPILRLNPVSQLGGVLKMGDIRALLLAVFLLNLSFAGLLTNFPLFSNVRFGWDATGNAFFFAFVGVCAVLTQGVLLGRLQPLFGEGQLLLGGLSLMALNLGLIALVPSGWMLYPVVGVLAVGTGLAIPSLTALISRRVSGQEQGKVMGGQQAILSLTLILGPVIAGLAFDHLGGPAPYWIGGFLAALALLVAAATLLPKRRKNLTGRRVAGKIFPEQNTVRKAREPRA
jgi:DHA1 family tetracycline resistance protein-like MFS transporter